MVFLKGAYGFVLGCGRETMRLPWGNHSHYYLFIFSKDSMKIKAWRRRLQEGEIPCYCFFLFSRDFLV